MLQNWNEMVWFFFTFIEECCVEIEKNIDKNLQKELVTKYDTNDA